MGTVRHRWSYKGIGGTKSFYARVRGIKVWRRFDVTVPQKKNTPPSDGGNICRRLLGWFSHSGDAGHRRKIQVGGSVGGCTGGRGRS